MIDAWADVGGTFTDCVVRRQDSQQLEFCKVLSSGFVPVSIAIVSENQAAAGKTLLQSEELSGDVNEFWSGAKLKCVWPGGEPPAKFLIEQFSGGRMLVSVPAHEVEDALRAGAQFEIDADLNAPVLGIRRLLRVPLKQPLPVLSVRIGTTRGTNALLTRRGARTALAITAPFEDLLAIGDQTRPRLFDLEIRKPPPLAETTIPIAERIAADGTVIRPIDLPRVSQQLKALRNEGYESLAICLMHSHVNPAHEEAMYAVAREQGFRHVSVSSRLAPLIEIVARAETAVVDAYLNPVVQQYLAELQIQFGADSDLLVMTSAGGLVGRQEFSGKDSILSGPAGGVCALRGLADALDSANVIGLDMGGTSTDVCRVGDAAGLQYESHKAGVRILTPTLPIETVAAGGGSVCWFDGVSLRVGPHSAGAMPGPACYGRGGPLTITDLNVFQGRIPASQFPFPIDETAIGDRLDELLDEMKTVTGIGDRAELCSGFRRLANEQMAEAVRTVSIAQGVDPREHMLVGFGGAAGQHICEIAEILEISEIADHEMGGVLSALGMGVAESRQDDVIPVYRQVDQVEWHALAALASERIEQQLRSLRSQAGIGNPTNLESRVSLFVEARYAGTDATLRIAILNDQFESTDWQGWPNRPELGELESRFHQAHLSRFGYRRSGEAVEVVALRIEVALPSIHSFPVEQAVATTKVIGQRAEAASTTLSERSTVKRSQLEPGDVIHGPATVLNEGGTLTVEPGWEAKCLTAGTIRLTRNITQEPLTGASGPSAASVPEHGACDVVFRDCYAARMSAIASQMGTVLQQTAVSVNVKQRRDFSCAVFDARGQLLANAPHVPVHLGAMGLTVRALIAQVGEFDRRAAYLTNDPYRGGSHLPDLTVVTPVFESNRSKPVMFVANRAHHADIGGATPGSMNADARCLGDEGVVIEPMRLSLVAGEWRRAVREVLAGHRHPPRNINENLSDIGAQIAANQRGIDLLEAYASQVSWGRIEDYAEHLLAAGDARIKQFIGALPNSHYTFQDEMDDHSAVCVRLDKVGSDRLKIDFSLSADVHAGNLNASPSIVSAAVLYVLRTSLADDLPLNDGVMRSVDLEIPVGMLNPPRHEPLAESPAVAAGNVETSQRVVDVLLGALGMAAASQGTMNNLLFGNARFGFYETICGGAGATANASGASAVHTHMTNTKLTDPEVLEKNYPVILREFAIRRHSGGVGKHAGGDGVVRELEFTEPVTLSLLTSRRTTQPFGLHGGQPGLSGRNTLLRGGRDGPEPEHLDAHCTIELRTGDRIRIETPGGGGYGTPDLG